MLPQDILIGKQLVNFRVERLIGRGGMGSVYYGWDVKLERPVAIKAIDSRFVSDPTYTQRLIQEAQAIAAWNHPNIIRVYFADDEDGISYFVMEYIEGRDLGELMDDYADRGELLSHADVLWIGRAIASALDYAHRRGVIHRDVKPSNVMIAADGRVVLMDFGLAMQVQRGTLGHAFGSPQYMAPEQARNSAHVQPQSDLYALAVILYEMLTGSLPFDDPSPTALAMQHITQQPPAPRQLNPALSPAVDAVLLTALSKDLRERYPTGEALMQALALALEHAPVEEAAASPGRTLSQIPIKDQVVQKMSGGPTTAGSTGGVTGKSSAQSFTGSLLQGNPVVLGSMGCIGLIVMIVSAVALGIFWFLNRNSAAQAGTGITPGPGSLANIQLTQTAVALSGGLGLATATTQDEPIATEVTRPATTPTALIAVEITPPATSQTAFQPTTPDPAATPTQAEPAATQPPETQPPAAGDLYIAYYNGTSFYLQNLSGRDVSIYPFAFERLNKDGNPTGERFEGWRWAEIYPKFRAGYCMVLELLGKGDFLRPEECEGRHLVIRTPVEDEAYIFWTRANDTKTFRVLFNDVEVGRCETEKKTCEFYVR